MVMSRAAFGVQRQRAARRPVLGAPRRLGDRAGRAGHAGDRDGVRPSSAGRRRRHQGGGVPRGGDALVVGAGVLGFDVIMRLQAVTCDPASCSPSSSDRAHLKDVTGTGVSALPSGSTQAFIGALIFVMTGFGLGWVNAAADYSRYLPRTRPAAGVVGWTTFGGAAAPILHGLRHAAGRLDRSSSSTAIANDPIGALTTLLPTWFLVPFALVAVLGLVGGAVLDIYSSGLALLTLGVRRSRGTSRPASTASSWCSARSTSCSSPAQTSSCRSRAS